MAEEELIDKAAYSTEVERAISASIQGDETNTRGGTNIFVRLMNSPTQIIAPWWSSLRDSQLRSFWKGGDHISGAVYTFESRIKTIPFRIEARDKSIRKHVAEAEKIQESLYASAEYGENGAWKSFIGKFTEDLITQDNGAFAEVIGLGDPEGPIVGQPISVKHLDSSRCQRTGDPLFPVVFNDLSGKMYKLHYTRVIYVSQMASPNANMFGVGFCALSRAINTAQNLIDIAIYKQEKLGSRPTRQVLITRGGLDPDSVIEAMAISEQEMTSRNLTRYSKTVVIGHEGMPDADMKAIDLASLPDGFDEESSTILGMATISLAFGVDARELFPSMSSGANKADALVQHLKQRGKGYGEALGLIESVFNYKYLPRTMRMVFDFQDDAQDKQVADIRNVQAKTRAFNIQNLTTSVRVEREKMLENGEITLAQFVELELDDGRMEDGTETIMLFFHPEYSKYLDIGITSILDIEGNDPDKISGALVEKKQIVMADIVKSPMSRQRYFKEALSALESLERMYEEKQIEDELAEQESVSDQRSVLGNSNESPHRKKSETNIDVNERVNLDMDETDPSAMK